MKKHHIEIDDRIIIPYDLSLKKVETYVKYLVNLEDPPDALFTLNDTTAIEVMQIIKKIGLRIPEDIAVAGFSDDYMAALFEPRLTTVVQNVDEMGKIATQLFIDQINREVSDWKAITKMIKTNLIIRDSTSKISNPSYQ